MRTGNTIYMDYQASTPIDPLVKSSLIQALDDFGNPHSSEHAIGWKAADALNSAQERVARALHVDHDEVVFTSGATESNNFAVVGACSGAPKDRRTILLPQTEHKCTLESVRAVRSLGFEIEYLEVHQDGSIDLDYLSSALSERVALVSVMAVHNEIGTTQPMPEIVRLAHEKDALVHSDAVQLLSVPGFHSLAADVDILSFSAHKIYGPKGIGFSIVRREAQRRMKPLLHGGGQQSNLRSGTVPMPLSVACAEAVELMTGQDAQLEREKISELQRRLWDRLRTSRYPVRLNGPDLAVRHPGNLNLAFPDFKSHEIISMLQPHLAISSGSACSSGTLEPSHVLQALGLPRSVSEASIRIGFGRFTTHSEVELAADLLIETLDRLRALGTMDRQDEAKPIKG